MQAVRFQGVGRPAIVADVPKPRVGAGLVLIKIGGAGVCHSDLHWKAQGRTDQRSRRIGTTCLAQKR